MLAIFWRSIFDRFVTGTLQKYNFDPNVQNYVCGDQELWDMWGTTGIKGSFLLKIAGKCGESRGLRAVFLLKITGTCGEKRGLRAAFCLKSLGNVGKHGDHGQLFS